MKLRKKIISTILVVIMVMCMIPVDCVYAAGNGLIRLKQGEVCAKYDITGNGKKDTIQYSHTTRDNIKVYVNGKCCLDSSEMTNIKDTIYICALGKHGMYLLVSGQTNTCNSYVYKNGKFVKNYDFNDRLRYRTIPMKLDGNILYVKTLRFGLSNEYSFSQVKNLVPIVYKFKLENKKVKLISENATVGGKKVYTALQKFKTSSTSDLTDTDGPEIPKGAKVRIIKCRRTKMSYPLKIQISYKGKTGWFKSSNDIQLY